MVRREVHDNLFTYMSDASTNCTTYIFIRIREHSAIDAAHSTIYVALH